MHRFSRLVALVTLIVLSCPALAFASPVEDDRIWAVAPARVRVIPGRTYTALPETGLGGPTTPASLDVERLEVSADEILMDGAVTYEGKTLPFRLRGEPFSSRLGTDGDIVGSLRDERGNFEVVHFSMRENPGCAALTDGNRVSGRILMLYLLRENT